MRAVVLRGPNDLRIEEVPKPIAGPGEVVVRIAATGICGMELEIYYGVLSFPWTPGHEWSGVVDHVGEGVASFRPGDRVTGEVSIACNKCEACLAGNYNLCHNRNEIGCTGRYPGAFADYLRIPARHTVQLPDGLSLRARGHRHVRAAATEAAARRENGGDRRRCNRPDGRTDRSGRRRVPAGSAGLAPVQAGYRPVGRHPERREPPRAGRGRSRVGAPGRQSRPRRGGQREPQRAQLRHRGR